MTSATHPKVPRKSHKSEVHRNLVLTSPQLEGPDVRALQQQLNHQLDHYQFNWRLIQEDGSYGKRTQRAAGLVAWLIGLNYDRQDAIKGRGGRITDDVQRLLRNPKARSDQDRDREDDRRGKRIKLLKKHSDGVQEVYDFLKKNVGTNEEPPESNHGPFPINECQSFFGLSGAPWCGCLVGYAVVKVAGITSVKSVWWPHAGFIRQDAEAGRNGLRDTNPKNAKKGMPVTFFSGGDEHVGWIRADVKPGDTSIKTFEGNTSSATRDADGGIIEEKERSFSEITCVAVIEDWD